MPDTDRLHRAGEYLRKQEQHQHADAVDQACFDLDNLNTRVQKALCLVHSILNPGSPIDEILSDLFEESA